jgi:hypothetical protein
MKLRRYAVTISDNWTPMRTFWTLKAARRFQAKQRGYARLFVWLDGQWWPAY